MRWIFSSPLKLDRARIVAAIHAAEANTSAEIRVVVARHRAADPFAAATQHFSRLGMEQTKERNGVLVFVAPRSRNFAVIGDQGIHEQCGEAFWTSVAEEMTTRFRQGAFTDAVLHGIGEAGRILQQHFPRHPGDRNQLPDDVEEVD